MSEAAFEPRNKDIEDIKDMPKEKVERHDGLPTVDDLEELMAKSLGSKHKCGSPEEDLNDFVQVIIKIAK